MLPLPGRLSGVCRLFFSLLLLGLSGCVDKFAPDVITAPTTYLVVDGSINLRGATSIRLSRTQNLAETAAPLPEAGATAYVQDDQGQRYPLAETEPGLYASAGTLSLSAARQYQLRLRTRAGREYASDLVTGKLTPPIDKVAWAAERLGVQVSVSAHDPAGATRYYRWRYAETWEFESAYRSYLVYDGCTGTLLPRPDDITHCWRTETAKVINLSSTAKLSQDVVSNFPLLLLPANSDKFRFKYSLLVQQLAQTPEEYAYWENLKKNTESLGGLFDAQPTQLTGNVRCLTDAAEPVIGYVGAGSVAERRIFIDNTDFPFSARFLTGYEACSAPDTILVRDVAVYFGFGSTAVPLHALYIPFTSIIKGYTGGTADCVDCRRRGTNQRPAFWP